MKTLVFTSVLLLFVVVATDAAAQKTSAQGNISFGFPLPTGFWLYKDTVANTTNIWNEGLPHKTVFNSSFYGIAMITDTGTYYPVSDTSSFIIGQIAWMSWQYPGGQTALTGHYWASSDSLTDYGKIEVSVDNGINWTDILKDTTYNFFSAGGKPVLTGNSNGWKAFQIDLNNFADSVQLTSGDTILFKFSFVSDSVQTFKDGLMFDELFFYDMFDGIFAIEITPSKVYPNPSKGLITVQTLTQFHYNKAELTVSDVAGRQVLRREFTANEKLSISVSGLQKGLYFYKVLTDKSDILKGRFLKE